MSKFKNSFNSIPLSKEERLEVRGLIESIKLKFKPLVIVDKNQRKKMEFIAKHKRAFCEEIIDAMQDHPQLATPSRATPEQMIFEYQEYQEWLKYLHELQEVTRKLEVALMLKGAQMHDECKRVFKTLEVVQLDGELESVFARIYNAFIKRPAKPKAKKSAATPAPAEQSQQKAEEKTDTTASKTEAPSQPAAPSSKTEGEK